MDIGEIEKNECTRDCIILTEAFAAKRPATSVAM